MKSKSMADAAIVFCCGGFVLSSMGSIWLPDNLMGKCLQLIFAAALIGGVADWYGVTSIFGKPLHSNLQTEIVIREKKALIDGIEKFVCNEVLSKDNIITSLQSFDLIGCILGMLKNKSPNGEMPLTWVVDFVSTIAWRVLDSLDHTEAGAYGANLLKGIMNDNRPSKELLRIMKLTLSDQVILGFINAAAPELKRLSSNVQLDEMVRESVKETVRIYSESGKSRGKFAKTMDFEALLYDAAKKKLSMLLDEVAGQPDHEWKLAVRDRVLEFISAFEASSEQQQKVDDEIFRWLNHGAAAKMITSELERLKTIGFIEEAGVKRITASAVEHLFIPYLENNPGIQSWCIIWLSNLIEKHHPSIGSFLNSNLNNMSNEELIAFIKDSTENDLQKIRLNGMAWGVVVCFVLLFVRIRLGIL